MILAIWTIFIVSALGLVTLLVSKVPEASGKVQLSSKIIGATEGLGSYLWHKMRAGLGKFWHFVLEAKDLKPKAKITAQVQNLKKVFKVRIRNSAAEQVWLPESVELSTKQEVKAASLEELYLSAIKKNPKDQNAYEGLAQHYLQEKNFNEAAETFGYLAQLNPNNDVYWSNLGLTQYSLRQYPQAIKSYERALNLNSKVPARWINLSLCFEAVGEYAKAVKAIRTALDFDKRNIGYLFLLADTYAHLKNKLRAEEVLRQILVLDPTNRAAHERLSRLN